MTIELTPEEFAVVMYALGLASGKLWAEEGEANPFSRLAQRLEIQWRHREAPPYA